ncbi:hypothetical protein BT93_B0086 [Corymbia citriodora subsp. variegata]|nr:hypothetical protein BT93_B0086 [Corymbia citriodora subsp. variegata]
MYRRDECQSWQQGGWDTTSQDYHEHVSRIARMPSIHPNVPQYPNVYPAFNNRVTCEGERESHHNHHQHNPQHRSPHFQEKVEVIEFQEERVGRNKVDEVETVEEVVDVRSDGFIEQKHRGFGLCKWNTA